LRPIDRPIPSNGVSPAGIPSGHAGHLDHFPLPNVVATVPPQLRAAFNSFAVACRRVLYDPKTHSMLQAELAKNVPLPQKLAEAAAGVVIILAVEARGKVPPPILAPTVTEMVGEVAKYVAEIGMPVNQAVYKQAVILAAAILIKKLGLQQQLAQRTQPNKTSGMLQSGSSLNWTTPAPTAPIAAGQPAGQLAQDGA
jgi:hypothetical protein